VSIFVANLLVNVPATSDPSAWYAGATAFALAIAVVLAVWGLDVESRPGLEHAGGIHTPRPMTIGGLISAGACHEQSRRR
jgi:hypothetical protein